MRKSKNSTYKENPPEFYSISPLNRFCFECKKPTCKGICQDFKNYRKRLQTEGNYDQPNNARH